MAAREPAICEPGGFGMIPPLTQAEQYWPLGIRGVLYGLALGHCFLGAAIVADTLMAAVETVTNRRQQVTTSSGRRLTGWVWNETIAKFTVVALGSSALEISISCVGVFRERLQFSDLGASTAVGSGAVGLLLVGAACMAAVLPGESRQIKEPCVCYTSAFFSILATLWLVFILVICTPDVVEVWEAIVTLLLYPVFVGASYQAEQGYNKLPGDLRALAATLRHKAGELQQGAVEAHRRAQPHIHAARLGVGHRLPARIQAWVLPGAVPEQAVRHESETSEVDAAAVVVAVELREMRELGAYIAFASAGVAVDSLTFQSSAKHSTMVEVAVHGPQNLAGVATCTFRTERLTAVPNFDYCEVAGRLEFTPEETERRIQLEIPRRGLEKVPRDFLLILEDAEGAGFDPESDGGPEVSILTVTVAADGLPPPGSWGSEGHWLRRLDAALNIDAVRSSVLEWGEQLRASVFCNGSWEAQKLASYGEWARHLIALPWKVASALMPPTSLFGGWACLTASIGLLTVVAILIVDFAQLFGCVCDIPEFVMGITFVALGASVPELFASLALTKEEPSADATFVRLTTKNAVNILFGLGVPWTMGTFHWAPVKRNPEWQAKHVDFPDPSFVVDSPALAFVVTVLSVLYILSFWLVHLRKLLIGAELGGPYIPKVVTAAALVLFWAGYIAIGSYRAKSWNQATFQEQGAAIGGIGAALALVALFAAAAICGFHWPRLKALVGTVRPCLPDLTSFRKGGVVSKDEQATRTRARDLEEKEALREERPAPASEAEAAPAASAGTAAPQVGCRPVRSLGQFHGICPVTCGNASSASPVRGPA